MFPALSKIHTADTIQELLEDDGQEEMLRKDKIMAGVLRARAGGDVL